MGNRLWSRLVAIEGDVEIRRLSRQAMWELPLERHGAIYEDHAKRPGKRTKVGGVQPRREEVVAEGG